MTLPRVPSVTVAGPPARLAPGEESPGVFLLSIMLGFVLFFFTSV